MLKTIRYLFLSFLLLPLVSSFGQTCSITSDSIVCLNELISFQATSSTGALSYQWAFGDGNSSTSQNPLNSYNSVGTKKVTLVVTYANDVKCSATKSIVVHDLPKADFEIENSVFCFTNRKLCLRDKSTMGSTTTGYGNRIILWGDGGSSISGTPSTNDLTCYTGYPAPGNYSVTVEVKNDKGCENKWEKDIEILKDYSPSFDFTLGNPTCNELRVTFDNDSSDKDPLITKFVWDFGDGTKDSSNWSSVQHTYTSSGKYVVRLFVTYANGCVTTDYRTVDVVFPEVKANLQVNDSVFCVKEKILAKNDLSYNKNYFIIRDLAGNAVKSQGPNFASRFEPNIAVPGKYTIQLITSNNSCKDTSEEFAFEIVGVQAKFLPLNVNTCTFLDTSYFLNTSVVGTNASPRYFWKFNDDSAASCTGHVNNCNFDTAFNSQHFYGYAGCKEVRLIAYDDTHQCVDSTTFSSVIRMPLPKKEDFSFVANRPCIGSRPGYGLTLFYDLCGVEVKVNWDSACSRTNFVSGEKHTYLTTCDSSQIVKIGVSVKTGDSLVYRSADSLDFYTDPSRVCLDTFWFSEGIQLFEEPEGQFTFKAEECVPTNLTVGFEGEDSALLHLVTYDWDEGGGLQVDTIQEDTFVHLKHVYMDEGRYQIAVLVEDTNKCQRFFTYMIPVGYFQDFTIPDIVCPGVETPFTDNLYYWETPLREEWKDTLRAQAGLEQLSWDFGDGSGFSQTGPDPEHVYQSKGTYIVTMASKDDKGCRDTLRKEINVGGVNAVIKDFKDELLCDQIVQFFDSSYSDFEDIGDYIEKWEWDFGDKTTRSLLKDPFHYYKTNGELDVRLVVSSPRGCTDTTYKKIYIKGPEPYFDILFDTVGCMPFTAIFESNSTNVSSFIWRFGDEFGNTFSTDKDMETSFEYLKPGTYSIYLEGADSFYNSNSNNFYTCKAVFPDSTAEFPVVREVTVLPIPEVDFDLSEPNCVNQPVLLTNGSDSIYDIFNWFIVDDPKTVFTDTTSHVFDSAGVYQIRFKPTYIPEGPYERECYDSTDKLVTVEDVEAFFRVREEGNCVKFLFTDSSTNAASLAWDFGHPNSEDDNYSDLPNPEHVYTPDTGTFTACLVASSAGNCKDTFCTDVRGVYTEISTFYNVFTPNNDGLNDEFTATVIGALDYQMKVYNRWGEKVFESTDPNLGWNGKVNNSAQELPEGVYYYVIEYQMECTLTEEFVEGSVTLIRD